jgi:hypothetical protein
MMTKISANNSLPNISNFCDTAVNEVPNTVTGGAAGGSANSGLCAVSLPSNLKRRKIYAWIYVKDANAYVKAQINFYRNGSPVGSVPISLAGGTVALNETLINVCTTGGTSITDTIAAFISNPVDTQPQAITLQPQYLYGEMDKADISITDKSGVSYVRLLLVIISN